MANAPWRLKNHVEMAMKEAAYDIQDWDPETQLYKVIPTIRIVRKMPRAFHEEPVRIVGRMLTEKFYFWHTNAEIWREVAARFAPVPVPSNFMDKPLSKKQLKAIDALMAKAGLVFDPRAHKSLSRIKLAIRAGRAVANAEECFTGPITFGRDYVTVGTTRYAFTRDANGYSRIKVGSQKLRVDVLRDLLRNSHPSSST